MVLANSRLAMLPDKPIFSLKKVLIAHCDLTGKVVCQFDFNKLPFLYLNCHYLSDKSIFAKN